MDFREQQVLPGVRHIQDPIGVCATLICGQERALLVDTCYGIADLSAFVKTLTSLPVTVLLTHGHHDHALGAMHFPETWMFSEDQEDFLTYTREEQRQKVLAQSLERGLPVDVQRYLNAVIPMPHPMTEQTIDLGGLHARIILCPGHTAGSCMVYVPEYRLLLTGDNWNPCTWLWFPKAVPLQVLRANMRQILSQLEIDHVLCSHQPAMFSDAAVRDFYQSMTDERIQSAYPVDLGKETGIDTRRLDLNDGQYIVFDWQKYLHSLPKEIS